jgi:hypothetical protein
VVYLAVVFAALIFAVAIRVLNIPSITLRVIDTGRGAALTMSDGTIADADKERLLQQASLTMMAAFASITVRTALAIAASLVPLLALQAAGVAPFDTVVHALATWQGIAVTSVAMVAAFLVKVPS